MDEKEVKELKELVSELNSNLKKMMELFESVHKEIEENKTAPSAPPPMEESFSQPQPPSQELPPPPEKKGVFGSFKK